MVISKKSSRVIGLAFSYVLLLALIVFFTFPFVFMINKSFMDRIDTSMYPVRFFPRHLYLDNYKGIFEVEMLRWLGNTMYITVFNMIGTPLSSSLVAYGFSKCDFKGKRFFFTMMISTIMLPGVVMQIPMYVIYNSLGWIGTYNPLTIPCLFGGGAMNVFLFMQFMKNIPREMDNAAKIDGANALVRYFYMTLPICVPLILMNVINIFMGCWNDYMGPLIYASSSEDKYTVGLGIYYKFIVAGSEGSFRTPGVKMAIGVLLALPSAVLFFIFQRQLIDGIMIGGVKG